MGKTKKIILDAVPVEGKHKKSLLEEYDELEQETSSIASYRPKKKEETEAEKEAANEEEDDWLTTIAAFRSEPVKASKGRRRSGDIFDLYASDGKKKKKKKKKGEDPVDYLKEFGPEIQLVQNLLREQTRFTDSLQKRYDILDSSKSTARGVGKFTTDLIAQVSQARTLSSKLVKDLVDVKKTAIDFNMKERKERGAMNNGDSENLSEFSANYLKKLIQEGRNSTDIYDGDGTPIDGTSDDLLSGIKERLIGESDRTEETEKYLKYENDNIEIVAVINPKNEDDYYLVAEAEDGRIIDDYPLPEVSSLKINHSANTATDEYYNVYNIRWEK